MFAVTVRFDLAPGAAAEFIDRMKRQARDSLEIEESCRHFDICVDSQDESRVFLYELYDDAAAFDAHLASDHFKSFAADVEPLLRQRVIETWDRL